MLEDIQSAAVANVSLKPSKVSRGRGLGYIPAAVHTASANMDRISTVMSKARSNSVLCSTKWNIASFERIVDEKDAHESIYVNS